MPAPMFISPLNETELVELADLRKKTHSALIRSRCEMVLYSHQGLTPRQIAQRVPYSDDTVRRVLAAYQTRGRAALDRQKPAGPKPKVNTHWLQELETAVSQDPRDLGLPFSTWSCGRLGSYLAEQTGIRVSERTVERYLKAHRWRLRRPAPSVKHKQDPVAMAEKRGCSRGWSAWPARTPTSWCSFRTKLP